MVTPGELKIPLTDGLEKNNSISSILEFNYQLPVVHISRIFYKS